MTDPEHHEDEPLDPAADGPVGGGYTGALRHLVPPPDDHPEQQPEDDSPRQDPPRDHQAENDQA